MAAQVPASLKKLDISRYALRAAQLENVKPAIAYWCNYWIAQQILQKEAHNADDAALQYTTALMDRLEKFKNEHSTDDTITDDVAGKAFVEQFGLDTFTRADNAMRTDKVTKQTADTLLAAATFLELLAIWGHLDAEATQKIKFSKYHALRILNAYKAGEDPNLSNPKPEPTAEQAVPPLDPSDPEVQALDGSTKQRQPSVIDAPDETDLLQARQARQSNLDESLHPSRTSSVPPPKESLHPKGISAGVSPLARDAASFYTNNREHSPISPDRRSSVGGNYFPQMPSPTSSQAQPNLPPTLPSAPTVLHDPASSIDLPSAPADLDDEPSLPAAPTTFAQAQPPAPKTPLDSFQAPPTPGQVPFASIPTNLPQAPPQIPPHTLRPVSSPCSPPPLAPSNAPAHTSVFQPPSAPSQPARVPVSLPAVVPNAVVDEEAMMMAQKHARWAISALNFEDVSTAIKEFELALQSLGAR
ncbi:hypothetical protein LTR05_005300 [Lithohypha guttulata]|uniref:DUF605-domain-containing protein n=1 Tax=Lithohypha guttulata TaxID=1690604 RepID=A0AAN7Y9X7_9EURO|nr:hypothetical protein LTR05_005300 [Lithohypha guttulata]